MVMAIAAASGCEWATISRQRSAGFQSSASPIRTKVGAVIEAAGMPQLG
jgi:hypothetical protein